MSYFGGDVSKYLIPVKKNAVSDWVSQSELLRDRYNLELDNLLDIYDMVANFIKRKQRILVGGMAIDYALRLVGSKLYKVDKIDYDFVSPDYHNDAYELGNEVAKKYTDVSVICAKHISTMRVRYKFMAVADITYVPKVVFDKIQTLKYEGFIIIHPWVQQIDQIRAMRNMLEGSPKEMVLSNRIEKDTKRYRMLAHAYPIDVKELPKTNTKEFNIEFNPDYVLCGFPAAIFWLNKFDENILDWSIKIHGKSATIKMPDTAQISYLVDGFPSFKDAKYYNKLLDKLYPRMIHNDIVYFDGYGDKHIVEELTKSIYVDGFYGTLMWLSVEWLMFDNLVCGYIYSKLQKKLIDNPVDVVPDFKHIFGSANITSTQMMAKRRREDPKSIAMLLPKNAYPEKGESIVHNFDLTKSEVLQLDGLEINK